MLVSTLVSSGCLRTPRIIDAFRKIRREDFLPPEIKHLSPLNAPLPIGEGQTISQPLTVAFMFELLAPGAGDRILDVGSGSGWTAALLSEIVGKSGKVYAIEILPKIKDFGEKNAAKYGFAKKGILKFHLGDGTAGIKEKAPFDKILVSASAPNVPGSLKDQLKIGGVMVIPVKNSILRITKKEENCFLREEYPGFVFVPLISKSQAPKTS
ncbi:MAG: protein-L-isoaspartate O-methyltransferase [Candidatus Aenigmarchaeota archaeon]|nr:protein-L-isoaspartate O-methyltransferase [Candidatus Aenigmarchaeota archaeon]